MKKRPIFFTLLLILSSVLSVNAQSTLKERLERHVYTLASDSLQGREAGTRYARMASDYVIRQWQEIGIEPFNDSTFLQKFNNDEFQNVVGIIPGNDEYLKDEYIVIGAHYDHLGVRKDQVYNGADDNASGVAALIELGRALKRKQPDLKRSVILIALDAEEIGLVGSKYFINNTKLPVENIKLMISVDMVGWYKVSSEVTYAGTGTIKNGKTIVQNPQLIPAGLNVVSKNFETSVLTATDTEPFAKKGIPTLAVTTGTKSPYHKPEDDAHLIDYDGMALITEHLTNVVEAVSNDTDYAASGKVARKHAPQPLFTFGIVGNLGSNFHHYTDGAVEGKTASSLGVGLMTQVNFKNFALRPEFYYERVKAKHPVGTVSTDNLTVPLSLVFQSIDGGIGTDFFFGGYYSYRLNGKQGAEIMDFENTFNRNEFGLTYGVGLVVRPFKIGFTNRTALTNFTKFPNDVNAHIKNRANYFTIGFVF